MAEALLAIEVAGGITEIVHGLYEYIAAVKHAREEILKLTQELFALKGALEHFDVQIRKEDEDVSSATSSRQSAPDGEVQGMLRMTLDTLDSIQKKLDGGNGRLAKGITKLAVAGGVVDGSSNIRLRQGLTALVWPFRSGDVDRYLVTLERAKTWFIMVIMRDNTETTSAIYAEVQRLSEAVHEDIISRRAEQMQKDADDIIKWLSPVNPIEELARASTTRVPGTGQWIWDGSFTAWECGAPTSMPLFWITGKTGSGKTILFSSIVDEMRLRCVTDKSMQRGIGVHCCSLDNAATQPVNNVFGSILSQAAMAKPELIEHLRPLRKSGSGLIPQNNLTIQQIHILMGHVLKLFDCFYVLVDALNETPYDVLVIRTLVSLCEQHRNLRVLVTSTREPPDDNLFMIDVRRMNESVIDLDIETYVQQRLLTEHSFRSLSPMSRSEVRHRIVTGSHGVFRWAKLCLDRLSTYRTGRDIKLALLNIPSTLHETYAATLSRIPENDREIARESLMWLCFSLRPLKLDELAEAVVLQEQDTFLDNDSRFTDPSIILEICQGLVYSIHNEVTLAHDSIRTFLLSDWIRTSKAASFALEPAESHRRIMRKCLAYLKLDAFSAGPVDSRTELTRLFTDFPLLHYASELWPMHSERAHALLHVDEELILGFFGTKRSPNSGSFGSWVQFLLDSQDLETIHNTEPLYYAASYNMVQIIRLLLRQRVDVNKRGGRYRSTPLFIAVWRENLEAAKVLVEAGADPYLTDTVGLDSLDMAFRQESMAELVEMIRARSLRTQ